MFGLNIFNQTKFEDIKTGSGGVLYEGGKKVALYKDKSGKMIRLSAKCTHMGCTVHWNDQEKTWDCPCHGSKFAQTGKVIHGPATKDLQNIS